VTDLNQRIANWTMGTDTVRTKQTIDTKRPDMLKRYEASVVGLCETE
jgi:hypothetical protein